MTFNDSENFLFGCVNMRYGVDWSVVKTRAITNTCGIGCERNVNNDCSIYALAGGGYNYQL